MKRFGDKQRNRSAEQSRAQVRKRILKVVLVVVAVVSVLFVILLLRDIQQALFPTWLIKMWWQAVATAAILMIVSVIVLPVIIEANTNPRVLSGPGKTPPSELGGKVVDD